MAQSYPGAGRPNQSGGHTRCPTGHVQPGSVTFLQRFGSAINLHVHFHRVFLEGVSLDRADHGRTPRFLQSEPPSDADIAALIAKSSHRVIRTRRRRGYLEAGSDDAVPNSHLREAIIPTPRHQGVEDQEDSTASPRWSWARLLKRVFALEMAHCPWCQRGSLRISAAITQGEVIRTILRYLQRAVDPPPLAPARVCQEAVACSSPCSPMRGGERTVFDRSQRKGSRRRRLRSPRTPPVGEEGWPPGVSTPA